MVKCLLAIASAGLSAKGCNYVDFTVNYVFSDRVSRNTAGQATVACSFDATATEMNAAFLAAVVTLVGPLDPKEVRFVNPFPK
jgi:hypothetical protein